MEEYFIIEIVVTCFQAPAAIRALFLKRGAKACSTLEFFGYWLILDAEERHGFVNRSDLQMLVSLVSHSYTAATPPSFYKLTGLTTTIFNSSNLPFRVHFCLFNQYEALDTVYCCVSL